MTKGERPKLHAYEGRGGRASDDELRKREREDVTRPVEPGELEAANQYIADVESGRASHPDYELPKAGDYAGGSDSRTRDLTDEEVPAEDPE